MQLVGERVHEQHAQPETRRRQEHETEHRERAVADAVLAQGADHAYRDADEQLEEDAEEGHHDGRREALQDGRGHRQLGLVAVAHAAVQEMPEIEAVLQRFPATVMIAVHGILFELLIGIPVGMISALKQYSFRDRAFTALSLVFLSLPGFFLGMMLMYFLAYKLQIFPLGGYEGWTAPLYGILPGLTIGLGGAAWYSRMLRSSMLDILSADYVKAARAKGLPERTVVWRHIMRNAWSPIVT